MTRSYGSVLIAGDVVRPSSRKPSITIYPDDDLTHQFKALVAEAIAETVPKREPAATVQAYIHEQPPGPAGPLIVWPK